MKFCSLFMGSAIVVAACWSAERLAELSVLTKEKLRHYLAFECAIREIAAVSDRHCLATDNPRTSVPSTPRPDLRDGVHCSFSLTSCTTSIVLSPFSTSSFTTLACLVCSVLTRARQLRSR